MGGRHPLLPSPRRPKRKAGAIGQEPKGAGVHPWGAPWLHPLPHLYIYEREGEPHNARPYTSGVRHPSPRCHSPSSCYVVHGEALWNNFTTTITMSSCCQNSSSTSPVLLDQEGEDVIELNVC